MGIWDFINSATDKVKENAPDLTPVKAACQSSYDYSCTTVTRIDNAVRETVVPRLNPYLPDDEGRAKIGRFAASFAKNASVFALHEGVKCIPGGVWVSNIASRAHHDEKTEDDKQVIKNMQARIDRLERELASGSKNNQAETLSCDLKVDSHIEPHLGSKADLKLKADLKPEDAIRIFMMKEFGGRYMFDELLVRGAGRGKNNK